MVRRSHLILGRSTETTVKLDCATASRVHALLVQVVMLSCPEILIMPNDAVQDEMFLLPLAQHKDDGQVYVQDLRSAHGTYVDGKKLDVNCFVHLISRAKLKSTMQTECRFNPRCLAWACRCLSSLPPMSCSHTAPRRRRNRRRHSGPTRRSASAPSSLAHGAHTHGPQ